MDVSLGSVMLGTGCCPCSMPTSPPPPPPTPNTLSLHVGDGSKGIAGPLQFGTSDVTGVARMRLSTKTNCLRGSNFRFFFRFTPEAIPKEG